MKVSLNQIQKYIDFELPPVDELVERVNQQLGGVEEIIDLHSKYQAGTIVRVVEVSKHPNADRLSVTKIDDGGVVDDVERDDKGLVQVVCGAPNVHPDMYAIWLAPGDTVPSTYDDDEPFVLFPKELRGVISNGMLAAADELAIGDDHAGIIDLKQSDLADQSTQLADLVGAKFSEVFGLDDVVIDIENKMFTHRPDLFGQIGVAREISAILQPLPAADKSEGRHYKNLDWYWEHPTLGETSQLELEVFNDAPGSVKRFMAVVIQDVEIGESPLWLKCQLVRMGAKPINSIVDATNYIMLLTAQPTHAYDYDKLRGHKIGTRYAQSGEKIELLNGKTYQLDESDIVIVDGDGPIGLGGVMGGLDSEVTAQTKTIVLEVANFDMYQIRKTSMRHGLFTDAVTRFSKGQSPLQIDRVMARLIEVIGGRQASNVFDVPNQDWSRIDSVHKALNISPKFVSERLGYEFSAELIGNMLDRVNFASHTSDNDKTMLEITAPFWRTDIELPEDIVEEVGRLYGFGELPRQLPKRSIKPAIVLPDIELKRQLRTKLSTAGANEILTYSFTNSKLLEDCGQNPEHAYKINNALSPDLQYYRLSLTPSLLDKIHSNIRAGHDKFALFEIGKSHAVDELDQNGLPAEADKLAVVIASGNSKQQNSAPFFAAKKYLTYLLGDDLEFTKLGDDDSDLTKPYQVGRSAYISKQGVRLGVVGEFSLRAQKNLKLPSYSAGFEIDLAAVQQTGGLVQASYQPLSRYPGSERDISLQVDQSVSYQDLYQAVSHVTDAVSYEVVITPTYIYQPEDSQAKNVTIKISFTSHQQTLTSDQVNQLVDQIVDSAKSAIGAQVV